MECSRLEEQLQKTLSDLETKEKNLVEAELKVLLLLSDASSAMFAAPPPPHPSLPRILSDTSSPQDAKAAAGPARRTQAGPEGGAGDRQEAAAGVRPPGGAGARQSAPDGGGANAAAQAGTGPYIHRPRQTRKAVGIWLLGGAVKASAVRFWVGEKIK